MPQSTQLVASDLRVHPSLRMHDHADGGGAMSGTPLTGAPGEIFPPPSDVDRVKGGFDARLLYFAVSKPGTASLYGAHALIRDIGDTPYLSYLLFPATKYGEVRHEIMQRIEAYSVGTIESRMTLLSRQTKNSRIVQAYQRVEEPLPQVGEVYCLRQDKRGFEQAEQYIQVIRVTSENRTFVTPEGKEFVRAVVKMEISTPLIHDFLGIDYPVERYADNPCKIRETHVADGANYFGSKPLAKAVRSGSLKIAVPSIFEKLVPTSQVETPLVDLNAAGLRQPIFDSGKADDSGIITRSIQISPRADTIYHLGNGCYPGTLDISNGSARITDDSTGTLKMGDESIGSIDYARGELRFIRAVSTPSSLRIKFRPAVSVSRIADTAAISVTLGNRGYNYLMTIIPSPAPGTLMASYRAQGRWYDLRDDGTGALRGLSEAHGSGNVNYRSGTTTVTLGALPDVGSEILFAWGNTAGIQSRADSEPKAKMVFQLANPGAALNSIQMRWDDGSAKTAQDDGSGNITGAWTGKVDYRASRIEIDVTPGFSLAAAYAVQIQYSHGDAKTQEFKAPLRTHTGEIEINLGEPIKERCLKMRWNLLIEDYNHLVQEGELFTRPVDPWKTVRDDGQGKIVDDSGIQYGTVEYATGKIKYKPDTTVKIPKAKYRKIPMGERIVSTDRNAGTQQVRPLYRYAYDGYEYIDALASMPIDDTALVMVEYRGTQSDDAATEEHTAGTLDIDLLPTINERVLPDGIGFVINGEQYFDRRGELYYRLNAQTGAAERCGTVNYETGHAEIRQWTGAYSMTLQSLATSLHGQPVDEVVFRAPSSPLRPQAMIVTATPLTGGQINVTANASSQFEAPGVEGYVIEEYGVARLRFGQKVLAAGNESKPWYNADEVDAEGKIWQPLPVHAESITFSAVSYAYLPLDTSQIGIDAVRLPSDGRVPWLRKGDMLVLINTQSESIGATHSAGQTVQLSRQNIDELCVRDADNQPVNAELYTYDLAAGTLTWKSPLDLSAYQQPLTVKHAIVRNNRAVEVDINGEITLQTPLDIDIPQEGTVVANALIGGDLQVRATEPFSQQSWDKRWADERTTDPILAKLNVKDHPIELSSDGAIDQRWAIQFTSDSQFEVIGETLGLIAEGNILSDLAPVNPSTGQPYFKIPRGAFGSGWAARNLIRFNTFGTQIPVWVIRAVQPTSDRASKADGMTVCLRGNTIDA